MYYTYIMANSRPTFYTGMTNNLERRTYEHRVKFNPNCFTAKYNLNKLVYFECFNEPNSAIIREKQIKNMTRKQKVELIKKNNHKFEDLYNKMVVNN